MEAGVRVAKVPRVLLTWQDGPRRLSRVDGRYAPDKFFQMKAEWIARWLDRELGGEKGEARKPRIRRMDRPGFLVSSFPEPHCYSQVNSDEPTADCRSRLAADGFSTSIFGVSIRLPWPKILRTTTTS